MRLHSTPDIIQGEFPVSMNRGTHGSFGVIDLGEGGTYLALDSDEDADRLIRAAMHLKEMRARMDTPHRFQPRPDGIYAGYCQECGLLKADGIHS